MARPGPSSLLCALLLTPLASCLDEDARPLEDYLEEYEDFMPDGGSDLDTDPDPEPDPEPDFEPLCSPREDGGPITVTFVSEHDEALEIYWVDWDCALRPYGQLAPDEEHVQSTFVDHVWRFRRVGGTRDIDQVEIQVGQERIAVGGDR